MAQRSERNQPFLAREPMAYGSRAAARAKIALSKLDAEAVTQGDIDSSVATGVAAHEAAADPHQQYVANDPTLR